MKRITKKEGVITQIDKDGNITKTEFIEVKDKDEANRKLYELEEIEEELGIELTTLFKALKGIWIKDNDRTYYVGSPYLCFAENNKRELEMQFRVVDTWFYIKDYGKKWALTREELEQWHQKNDWND